jgi:ferredoxin
MLVYIDGYFQYLDHKLKSISNYYLQMEQDNNSQNITNPQQEEEKEVQMADETCPEYEIQTTPE